MRTNPGPEQLWACRSSHLCGRIGRLTGMRVLARRRAPEGRSHGRARPFSVVHEERQPPPGDAVHDHRARGRQVVTSTLVAAWTQRQAALENCAEASDQGNIVRILVSGSPAHPRDPGRPGGTTKPADSSKKPYLSRGGTTKPVRISNKTSEALTEGSAQQSGVSTAVDDKPHQQPNAIA